MRSQGFVTLSYEPTTEPTHVLVEGRETYAVVPAKLRMRTPAGVYVSESFLIGVSPDDGKSWEFVSGTSATPDTLKLLMPAVTDKLKLPTVRNYPEAEKKP